MKCFLFLLVFFCSFSAYPQETKAWKKNNDIPSWILKEFSARGLDKRYSIVYRLYPSYLRGDFNGDNKKDVAFFVQENESRKFGIAIIYGKSVQVFRYTITILGAGEKISGLSDDVKDISVWSFAKRSVHSWNTFAVNYDAIQLRVGESVNGLLSWDGKQYSWHPDKTK